jgi:hypothetical protein
MPRPHRANPVRGLGHPPAEISPRTSRCVPTPPPGAVKELLIGKISGDLEAAGYMANAIVRKPADGSEQGPPRSAANQQRPRIKRDAGLAYPAVAEPLPSSHPVPYGTR